PHLRPFMARRPEPGQAPPRGESRSAQHEPEDETESNPQPSADAGQSSSDDDALFAALGAILAEHRRHGGIELPGSGEETPLPMVQQGLARLQSRASEAPVSGADAQQNMRRLQQDLLAQLRHLDPEARTPRLAAPQLNTIELMTMLFQRIEEDIHSPNCRDLLTRVQAPLLRVALDDHAFFSAPDHPARRWLNAAAEASARWGGDGVDGDSALLAQLQAMVGRINNEFNGDTSLFEGMRGDIERHVAALERKAQLAERRQVEASKGRERLHLARQHAEQAINERVAGSQIDSLGKALLHQAWADLLALTWLREGENSEAWQHELQVVDALAGKDTGIEAPALQEQLMRGLAQVGIAEADAEALARKVTSDEDDGADEPVSRTELALKLKQRARVGAGSEAETGDEGEVEASPPAISAAEQAALDSLGNMAFGTWFQVDREPPAPPARRKLAWYSRRTGHCLMVNQRGARGDIDTLQALARAMAAGTVRLLPPDRGSLIDRAWEAIVAKVKSLAGRGAAAEKVDG
ncbi:MAG TPA: DUF1631 family protein, partial [Rhodanobacteraceae bacterium]|nr:DUF1631 family protein [Rhodanobacteraceae bacterium]